MKKIALLLNTSWYIYNFRKNLILALINNGYQVHAFAPHDEYTTKLVDIGCKYHNIVFDSKSKNPFSNLNLLYTIRKNLSIIKPDVLLNFTIKPNVYGTLAANKLNIPCINNIAGMGTLYSDGFISRTFFKTLFKISQKNAKTVFFQNPDDFFELTHYNIVKKKIAHLLPGSGVNLKEFFYTPIAKNKKLVFLLVARMIHPKGIEELVKASKMLHKKGYSNFEVKLLGESNVNNPYAITNIELNDFCNNEYINYLGKTDNVVSYIQKCDCVILPSYYREGTPKSLLEALAIGRPIITTNMPGCKETVVDYVNGFICEPKSVIELANKMIQMLNLSYDKRLQMGKESRKLAENKFDEQVVIKEYLKAIHSSLN